MNTNKNLLDDKFHELFSEIPFDKPAPGFMENLLIRIEKEVVREKRKRQWIVVGQVAAGFFGIFILPALAIYLCTIFLPGYSFSFPKIHLNFDSKIVTIGFSVLMLLIIDTLLRMHVANRTKRDLQ